MRQNAKISPKIYENRLNCYANALMVASAKRARIKRNARQRGIVGRSDGYSESS